jgi:hypothetical protein
LIELLVGALNQVGGCLVVLEQRAPDANLHGDLLALKAEGVAPDAGTKVFCECNHAGQ